MTKKEAQTILDQTDARMVEISREIRRLNQEQMLLQEKRFVHIQTHMPERWHEMVQVASAIFDR